MKLNSIEYFIAVAECGSISSAAKKLYIAQPSLTKAIHCLEEDIGTPLFERTRTGMILTEAGEKILPEARQIIQYYHGWKEASKGREVQNICICSHVSLAGFLLPDIILRFRKKYPNVDITYFTDASPERFLTNDIHRPSLIFSICNPHMEQISSQSQGTCCQILAHGGYGCLVNRESPLAAKTALSFQDLKGYFLVLPNSILNGLQKAEPSQTAIMNFLPRLAHTISHKYIIEVDTVGNVIESVGRHPDVYALSFSPAHHRYEGVRTGSLSYIPLCANEADGDLCLFYSSEAYQQSPIIKELVRAINTDADKFLRSLL